ncbi:MAG: 30S ribosomal protein S1 [Phycisphaerales bacterium]|nr:30S ribosomal protein S1 [Phycisphaerales bacterium]
MVDYNLINTLEDVEGGIDAEVNALFGAAGMDDAALGTLVGEETKEELVPGTILKGKIIGRAGDDVVVDVGLKSEGVIAVNEWDDKSSIDIGDEVDVFLENIESDSGVIELSKRKADRIINWNAITETSEEGDVVKGKVMRKIKGGLLVDIGVPVFLPASQVDVRRPGDIGEYIGREIQAKILKIDMDRRNIVISRRKLIEEERGAAKEKLMATIEVGQTRKGTVKNIADFGAFVDLGGIDGLLHITDMSWDRINHPSALVKIDEEIEVKILNIDMQKEKIALGLKQLKPSPWENVAERYPINSKVTGEVVNIMNYGAFVKLEPGVEGLVHISEMSWTRRINHPSELINVGDNVEVVVLEVNKDKQEISLGMKQTEVNPWMQVAEKYPPNTRITGRVRNLTNYGAFVEIEEGIDGLLHVSDMSWTKKISHPSEMLKKGDSIDCVVLKVEENKQRIALGLKQLHEDPWLRAVPENYIPGQIVEGTVTKITNFGVFVELEDDLEGLLHVSELADHKIEDPHDEVEIGQKLQVKILRVDAGERKIGLSKKRAEWSAEQREAAGEPSVVKQRRGGLHGAGEQTTDLIPQLVTKPPVGSADDATETTDAQASSESDASDDDKAGE